MRRKAITMEEKLMKVKNDFHPNDICLIPDNVTKRGKWVRKIKIKKSKIHSIKIKIVEVKLGFCLVEILRNDSDVKDLYAGNQFFVESSLLKKLDK